MTDATTIEIEVDTCFLGRLVTLARERGLTISARELGTKHGFDGDPVPMSTVLAVASDAGMPASHRRMGWDDLSDLGTLLPALMVFRDQSTAIVDALTPGAGPGPEAILIREDDDEDDPEAERLSLDREELGPLWAGDMIVFD